MAKLIAARGGQYPLVAEYVFDIANDTVVDVNGATIDFKTVATKVFEVANLPVNAQVIGGAVVTETAVSGSTAYNVSVGDAGSATRYLSATDKTSAARTALVPTGYISDGGNIRLTVAPTVAPATAGKISVHVQYIIRNRMNESQTN